MSELESAGNAAGATRIVFGTDGWRAKIADEFNFVNVRRCAEAVAEYVVERGEGARGIVVDYDRRFASEHFAAAAAEVVLAHDIPVAFASQALPTQMSSFEVVQRKAAAGIVITASHNPWTDNGFKIKSPTGAAAGPEMLVEIERLIAAGAGKEIETRPFADAEAAGLVERYDSFNAYRDFIGTNLDLDRLRYVAPLPRAQDRSAMAVSLRGGPGSASSWRRYGAFVGRRTPGARQRRERPRSSWRGWDAGTPRCSSETPGDRSASHCATPPLRSAPSLRRSRWGGVRATCT